MILGKEAFVTGRIEVELPYGDTKITLYANEVGYLDVVKMYSKNSDGGNGIAMLVAESVTDKDGNKFTLEEVLHLKKEWAEPLFDAVIKVNCLGTEKN